MTTPPVLLWFRRDLRLADNPALAAAIDSGRPVVPVFIHDDMTPGQWAAGEASLWWMHHSLSALGRDLKARGVSLVLRRGTMAEQMARLMAETGAVEIHVGEPTEPWARRAIDDLAKRFPIRRHRTTLMFHPEEIRTGSGTPYGVFTPYANACRKVISLPSPKPAPARIAAWSGAGTALESEALESWGLLPTRPNWAAGFDYTPGEAGALATLKRFLPRVAEYDKTRNLPGVAGTSMLSPHLAWGEIAPETVWRAADAGEKSAGDGERVFKTELLWREFSAHLLWHFPALPDAPLKPAYAAFPWRDDARGLAAWKAGQTGIPLVDAGMRQLWQTGWMHNRVRMIVASFLIKHLLLPWQLGEAWFWDTLVDADLAANSASWQWVAGSGADAAPFFRVFNPALQGLKFDTDGTYVRRWVPELAKVELKYLHAPWTDPTPTRHYPAPIVDLAFGRDRALDALKTITKSDA